MDFGIAGKVALVAAGSKGIGLAIARTLAAEGALVGICARTAESLEAASEALPGCHAFQADVSRRGDLDAWYAEASRALGAPTILVTNTGGPPAGPWTEMSDEQWLQGFESTLMCVVRLVRLATPAMRGAGWGRIVHVTSLVAKEPNQLLPISSTLRSGLGALTRLQAAELGRHGITVNALLPGHTLTDRQRHLAQVRAERQGISVDQALELQGKECAVGRLGTPEEIAAAAAFLCSKPASYLTGVSLLVDGGCVKSPA